MGVLDEIVAGVRVDLAERQARRSLDELAATVAGLPPTRDPMPAFRAQGLAVITEVKRSSPSKGALADIPDPAALAAQAHAGDLFVYQAGVRGLRESRARLPAA